MCTATELTWLTDGLVTEALPFFFRESSSISPIRLILREVSAMLVQGNFAAGNRQRFLVDRLACKVRRR